MHIVQRTRKLTPIETAIKRRRLTLMQEMWSAIQIEEEMKVKRGTEVKKTQS